MSALMPDELAASQGSLAIAEVDVPSPAMSLDKGARLFVKDKMPAAWAQTQVDTAIEDDTV